MAGATTLRSALGRLRAVTWMALVTSVLVLVESYLVEIGTFGKIPQPGGSFSVDWITGVQIGVGIALGVTIAILVVVMIVFGVLGLIAWRRGVLGMTSAAPEMGPAHAAACLQARRDHSVTLWLFLVFVLAAIVVSATFAGVNGILSWLGAGGFEGAVGSAASGLATGAVLVLIYYYGTRHLSELLGAIATPNERALLEGGSSLMVAGAIVGLGAAFSSFFWAFNVFSVLSLAVILPGVGNLCRAYDLWLAEHRPASVPAALAGVPA